MQLCVCLHLCVSVTHPSRLSCICRATRVSLAASPVSFSASSCPCSCVDVLLRVIGFPRYVMDWLPWLLLLCHISHMVLLLFSEQATSSTGVSPQRPAPTLHEPCLDERSLGERGGRGGVQIFFCFFFNAIWYTSCFISCYLLSVMAMFTGDPPS